ncbi:Uma2 family endonuclease [Bacillus sp. FJAT-47783]|uniref:Uma2 family endonuclease n=1 Tax=Bacillus sp. FJAT-47783 TaxID=2922712 RepID=UPI001FABD5F9|nr:Uma2 family endonuclease [Bacillus sp. FJAT-47783]
MKLLMGFPICKLRRHDCISASYAAENEKEFHVVQPDISVVCDERKLDNQGCKGAPDLIIEVLSPSTWQRDRIEKLNQYQKYAVREYLLIYPNENIVEQYIIGDMGTYEIPRIYNKEDVFQSHIFPEFEIEMSTILS